MGRFPSRRTGRVGPQPVVAMMSLPLWNAVLQANVLSEAISHIPGVYVTVEKSPLPHRFDVSLHDPRSGETCDVSHLNTEEMRDELRAVFGQRAGLEQVPSDDG